VGPKIFPIMLLMNDPLPDCEGGGGTTVLPGSASVPPTRRRMSRDKSVEGGGATTDGAGSVTLEVLAPAFSGAETGGGITPGFMLCTGALVICRATAPGAGGMTVADNPGPERAWSREILGAGATTCVLSLSPAALRSRATFGAGGMTAGARAGATRKWLLATAGAGAISAGFSVGAVSVRSRVITGAGEITESS
jgi:hypothetical protein